VSDLNEQAEAVRILKDEQLGDMFELCHWVVNKTTCVITIVYRHTSTALRWVYLEINNRR